MNNNELLLAISTMLDTKLKSELQPIKNDLQNLKNELHNEIQGVKSEIQSVRSELLSEIQSVRSELHNEIQSVRSELHSEIQSVRSELHNEIHQVKLYQENIIMPRLNTIESCYLGTYDRYKNYSDKMDSAFTDIEIMKKVITDHSKSLQKIS